MVLQPAMLVANHLADLLRAGADNLADTHTGPYAVALQMPVHR